MNIGFGAYDEYRSLEFAKKSTYGEFSNFGQTSDCGVAGAKCKKYVKQEDIDEQIKSMQKARECCFSSNPACLTRRPLEKLVTKGIEMLEKLSKEGNTRAIKQLVDAVCAASTLIGLPKGGANRIIAAAGQDVVENAYDGESLAWSGGTIFKYEPWVDDLHDAGYKHLSWKNIANTISVSGGRTGMHGIIPKLVRTKDAIYFRRRMTPEQNARWVAQLESLLAELEREIAAGRDYAWIMEQRGRLRQQIDDAWITEADRDRLHERWQATWSDVKEMTTEEASEDVGITDVAEEFAKDTVGEDITLATQQTAADTVALGTGQGWRAEDVGPMGSRRSQVRTPGGCDPGDLVCQAMGGYKDKYGCNKMDVWCKLCTRLPKFMNMIICSDKKISFARLGLVVGGGILGLIILVSVVNSYLEEV